MLKFNVWKVNKDGNPIEGTDKIMTATSLRWLMRHIAYMEGVELRLGSKIVRLPNGEMWCGQIIS